MNDKRSPKKAIVILAVLACIALGVFLVVTNYESVVYAFKYRADIIWTKLEMKRIAEEINAYYGLKSQRLYEEQFDLWVADFDLSRGKPPNEDYFGTAYVFYYDGSGFVLMSCGPDRKMETEDDIILIVDNITKPTYQFIEAQGR